MSSCSANRKQSSMPGMNVKILVLTAVGFTIVTALTGCGSSKEKAQTREASDSRTAVDTQQSPRYSIDLERELRDTFEIASEPEPSPTPLTSNPFRSRPRGLTSPYSDRERYAAYYDYYGYARQREYQPAYNGRTPPLINRALNLNVVARAARIYR